MIYRIVVSGGTENTDIYGNTRTSAILDPKLDIELNSAGTLSFTIPPDNPAFSLMQVFKTELEVYEDNDIIWFGRVLSIEKDWNNQYKITCEGGLAYFNDSLQRPNEYKINNTTTRSFFAALIAAHNAQVEDKFKWEIGEYTSMDGVGVEDIPIWRQTDYDFTLDCLQQMCLDTHGGYLIVRKVYDDPNDVTTVHRYIDWVRVLPWDADQPVQFGLNLLDISRDTNGADVCTVVIPVGSDDLMLTKYKAIADETNPDEYGCYHIVNSDEVIHAAGVNKFGRVIQKKSFNDSSTKDDLYKQAAEWLERQNEDDGITTIECSAAELHYLYDDQYGKFQVGQKVTVSSPAHGIEEQVFPMYKISVSLNSGAKKITIGTPPKKELTDIIKSGSSTSTRTTNNSSGSGGSGSGGTVLVKDVKVKFPGDEDYKSSVRSRVSRIDMSGLVADVLAGNQSVKNENGEAILPLYDVELDGTSIVTDGVAALATDTIVKGNPLQQVDSGDLRKIKIGNHVFSIPEGGGGSGGDSEFEVEEIATKAYSWTTNYDPYPNPRTDLPVSLQSNLNRNLYFDVYSLRLNYDAFLLLVDFDAPKNASELETYTPKYTPFCMPVSMIDEATAHDYSTSISYDYEGIQYDFGYIAWTFRHGDNRTYLMLNHTSFGYSGTDYPNNGRVIGKLYGIKFGGGGGGVKDILVDGVSIVDPTTKTADFDSSKFGTPVEANPSDTPTDELESIKIGDTVYELKGGGSGGGEQYTCDLLFENDPLPAATSGTGNVTRTYTLDKSIDDYDAVVVMVWMQHTSSETSQSTQTTIYKQDYYLRARNQDSGWIFLENGSTGGENKRLVLRFEDSTNIQTISSRSGSGNEPVLHKIYGLKFTSSVTVDYPEIYSEDEREIGVWTDGKPLYQKTTVLEGTYKGSMNNVSVGLENIPIDIIPSITAVGMNTAGTTMHIPHVNNAASGDNSGYVITSEHMLTIRFSSNITCTKLYFTFRYTKTTDQPGSGHWLPGGTTAIQYSEKEQIIGQWIDGKTLYQKTFDIGALTKDSSFHDVAHNISGIDKVIFISGTAYESNGSAHPLSDYRAGQSSGITVGANLTNIFYSNNWLNVIDCTVTLCYTKTADTPAELKQQMLVTQKEFEAFAYKYHNYQYKTMSSYYSTEERVVGRWTDGKPLYQKTYDFGTDVEIGNSRGVDLSSYVSNYMEYEQIIYCLGYGTYNGRYADPLYLTTTLNNELMAWCAEGMTVRGITVQYTKTADAPGTGPTPGNIMYLPAMYSEEEREIGVWTDGKPLYQKTLIYTDTVVNNWVNHDLSELNIDNLSVAGGWANRITSQNVEFMLPLYYYEATSSNYILSCRYNHNNKTLNVYVKLPSGNSTNKQIITIQYTKTTDQPGGGTWTPDGQLAHHYSTSEHIIGTWIDGSTLYERTWDFGSDLTCNANVWTVTTIPNSGINLLVVADITGNNGTFRSALHTDCNYGDYVRIRPIGDAIAARYVTLRYTKT